MAILKLDDGRRFNAPDDMLPPEPERDPDGGIYFALLEMLRHGQLPEGITEIEGSK